MKKAILGIVIVVILVGTVVWVRSMRVSLGMIDAEFGTVHRGDLRIPIKASGKIQPAGRREIKSKASGEIIKVPFEVGKRVRQDDILVELKQDDELRSLDTAKATLEQAVIARDTAKINWQGNAEQTIQAAMAARDRAKADFERVQSEYKHRDELRKKDPDAVGIREWEIIQAQYDQAKAMVRSAEVDIEKAKIAKQLAEMEYRKAESALLATQKKYEDAEERLRETLVRSPIDGIVLKQMRHVGEMIQSGTQSLMGGTVLMELADVSEVYMVASVDEADIGTVREIAPTQARPGAETQPAASQPVTQDAIKPDTPVTISVEAFPDEKFSGVIERISPEVEVMQAVATFEVRIRITSENREKVRNLVGMQAEAEFTSVPLTNVLLVPYEAVKRGPGDELGAYIPVKKPGEKDDKPEFVKCKFGSDNGTDVVVISGLSEGQKVYTKLPIKTDAEKKAEEEKGS